MFLECFHGPFQNLGPSGNSDYEISHERSSHNPLELGRMLLPGKGAWEDSKVSPYPCCSGEFRNAPQSLTSWENRQLNLTGKTNPTP